MESKKTNVILVIILTILVMLLLFGIFLYALSKKGYLNFEQPENNNNQIENDSNNNDQTEDGINNSTTKSDIDYESIVGKYKDDSNKTVDDVMSTGGVILNITSISEKNISFEIKNISSNQRIATTEYQEIEITNIEKNIYYFKWHNDGWNNEGIGSIIIEDDNILLSVSTTKISDDNTTGWSLGNFQNKKMYKEN
jgi:hypothetical protein